MTTQIARESGEIGPKDRMWHLDSYTERGHQTLGMFHAEPSYADTRKMAIDAVEGKLKPAAETIRGK
jgi:hypothetical protein